MNYITNSVILATIKSHTVNILSIQIIYHKPQDVLKNIFNTSLKSISKG